MKAFLDGVGLPLDHIKPHGALYGMVSRDATLMAAVCDVAELYSVPVFGLSGTAHEAVAAERGVPFVGEFYVDLAYRADGSLIIPRRPSPVPVEQVVRRARLAVQEALVVADTGERLPVTFSSICVHSDIPGADRVAAAVREVLTGAASSAEIGTR